MWNDCCHFSNHKQQLTLVLILKNNSIKNLTTLILVLFSVLSFSQSKQRKEFLIDKVQPNDTCIAGENIKVNAVVNSDLIIAGGIMIVEDSIHGNLT